MALDQDFEILEMRKAGKNRLEYVLHARLGSFEGTYFLIGNFLYYGKTKMICMSDSRPPRDNGELRDMHLRLSGWDPASQRMETEMLEALKKRNFGLSNVLKI